jgi:hypothetical protein
VNPSSPHLGRHDLPSLYVSLLELSMTRPPLLALAFTIALTVVLPASAEDPKPADGFTPLFNGKDLTGWVNVNTAPGTFFVKDGQIITTGQPTGFLRTDKQYENFELELDWMHVEKTKTANSGLFVWGDPLPAVGTPYTRGIEVQVLINYPKVDWATNHGDVFAIWGATCVPDRPHPKGAMRCLPSENRVKGGGEWNHYKVIANNGAIKLHVNGKEVSGVSKVTPRKGYLALESEGAECHFKNIHIKELPSTNPKPEEIANVWQGQRNIFTGLDLSGWKTAEGAWKAGGGVLRAAGKEPITTEKTYATPVELQFDWKLPAKSSDKVTVEVGGKKLTVPAGEGKPGTWSRAVLKVQDGTAAPIVIHPAAGLEVRSIFVNELKRSGK